MKELQERRKIIGACPIRIYIPSNTDRYTYPYRLQHLGYASQRIRDASLSYIMDSGIGNEEMTNEDVLDKAHELNASYVIPKDYLGDRDRTTESVHEFMEMYESHACNARPLIPLQPPHHEHYRCLEGYSHYTLGGMAQMRPEEQIAHIRRFREVAGSEPYAHALGMGCSSRLITELRKDPWMIDSLDVSTPENAVKSDMVPDARMEQVPFEFPRGDNSSTIRSHFACGVALELNYLLGPYADVDEVEQSTFEELEI